jgi:hypothetical protein
MTEYRSMGLLQSDIARVHEVIGPYIRHTPVLPAGRVAADSLAPGGAAAFASILSQRYKPSIDEHVAVVLCGGNAQR